MRTVLILAAVLLSGCSFLDPDQEFRVTEYAGSYLTAGLAGCRIVGAAEPKGCVKVDTEHCTYRSPACGGAR